MTGTDRTVDQDLIDLFDRSPIATLPSDNSLGADNALWTAVDACAAVLDAKYNTDNFDDTAEVKGLFTDKTKDHARLSKPASLDEGLAMFDTPSNMQSRDVAHTFSTLPYVAPQNRTLSRTPLFSFSPWNSTSMVIPYPLQEHHHDNSRTLEAHQKQKRDWRQPSDNSGSDKASDDHDGNIQAKDSDEAKEIFQDKDTYDSTLPAPALFRQVRNDSLSGPRSEQGQSGLSENSTASLSDPYVTDCPPGYVFLDHHVS